MVGKRVLRKIPLLAPLLSPFYRDARAFWGRRRFLQLRHQRPLKIVLGSSGEFEPGWVPTDAEYLNLLEPDEWAHMLLPQSVEAFMAEHVWEHLTLDEGRRAAALCFEHLRPGGHLRIAVPDGNHPDSAYIALVTPGGAGPGADTHQLLYTADLLVAMLSSVGFEANLLEYWDGDGQFHFQDWSSEGGHIRRSRRYDRRNQGGELVFTSLIVDGRKPA